MNGSTYAFRAWFVTDCYNTLKTVTFVDWRFRVNAPILCGLAAHGAAEQVGGRTR